MSVFTLELVTKMLDYVDCDPACNRNSKRRDAYVTEWYFENHILPLVTTGSASTGWCYIEENWIRHWFKVMISLDDNSSERQIDKQNIEPLRQRDQRQRFYIIYISSPDNTETISIREILKENDEWVLRHLQEPPEFCDIDAMNREAIRLATLPNHPNPFCKQWLKHCDKKYLTKLLLQRLLMNIALGDKFPLDVDAIEIDNDRLIFHEFKRKNKCPNGCFLMNGNITRSNIFRIINECNNQKSPYGPELFEFVEQHFGYSRDESAQCYGLDMSHLSNFEYCMANNIEYCHTIWDSGNYPDKPAIADLFDANLKPKKEMHLLSKNLEAGDFIGFIFTKGPNSGSFSKKLRGQATLNADAFQCID